MGNFRKKPLTAAVGAAFVASLASVSFADTAGSPFGANELTQGYNLLADHHGGDAKEGEGKCGEGTCGEETKGSGSDDKGAEGKCGEGKCGEGTCGEAKG